MMKNVLIVCEKVAKVMAILYAAEVIWAIFYVLSDPYSRKHTIETVKSGLRI